MSFFFKAFHFGKILFNLALYACSASWKKLSFCIFKGPCRPPSLEKEITVLEKVLNFGSKSLYEPWRIVQFTINNINFFIHDLTQIWGNNESMFLFFFYKLLLLYFFYSNPLFNIQVLCKHRWNISWDFLQKHDIFTSEKITIAMVSE